MNKKWLNRINLITLIVINVILLGSLLLILRNYSFEYQRKLKSQNLSDIEHLNQSTSEIVEHLFNSRQMKLLDVKKYIEISNMNYTEAIDYIVKSTQDNEYKLQLVDQSGKGYQLEYNDDTSYEKVDYTHSDYKDLQDIFGGKKENKMGDIYFLPEFTDSVSAVKSFALYTRINIWDALTGDNVPYTLICVSKSNNYSSILKEEYGYEGMSTVFIDKSGNYIVGNSEFKSNNFFQYIYVFNGIPLDEKNEVINTLTSTNNGYLYYKDAQGVDCVYVYNKANESEWYSISCVPISSFHNYSFDYSAVVVAVVILIVILFLDVLWLCISNSQLRKSMRMEKIANDAKTDFLSRMSHDIRTPLNGILGMTILSMDEDNPPVTAENLKTIKESGDFLLGLVNDVLDMSKVESGKMELKPAPYSYEEFCDYIKAVIIPLCESKHINFVMEKQFDDDTNQVLIVDRLRLNQIAFNLLSNAVKFTKENGNIKLTWVRHLIAEQRARVQLIVEDNGCGMSEEFQKHMFDELTQENRKESTMQAGTGLGLAIVNNLVKLMQGTIEVKSKEGVGTTFTITCECDITEYSKDTLNELSMCKDYSLLAGKRVLLCEDNAVNIKIAYKLLEKKGINVDKAVDGRIALDMFSASECGYYDAILMDIRMPEMNGLDAAKAIRALKREDALLVPIIAMTANAYDSDVDDCIKAGMNQHIAKPIDPDAMYRALCRWIGERSKER